MAKVTPEQQRRIDEMGGILSFDMAWSLQSPRSYNGFRSWTGHNGSRNKDGTWAGSKLDRRRLTTALHKPALDSLGAIAKDTGRQRCDVLEQLLLDPTCQAIAAALLKGEPHPIGSTPDAPPQAKRAINPQELSEMVLRLCQEHGTAWPKGMVMALAQQANVSRQAIYARRRNVMEKLEQGGEVG